MEGFIINKLNKIEEDIIKITEKIQQIKDENDLIRLRIMKKELILIKMELEELK